MDIKFDFTINNQGYSLANLARGRETFGLNQWWRHVIWIPIKSAFCLASEAEIQERDLYIAANKVIEAASKVFPKENLVNLHTVKVELNEINNENRTTTPVRQNLKSALQKWNRVHPERNNSINSRENTPLIQAIQVPSTPNSPPKPVQASVVSQKPRSADVSPRVKNINPTENAPLVQAVQVSPIPNPPLKPIQAPVVSQGPRRNEVSSTFNTQPCSREGNGNSCFVNTALQIIAHTPALFELFEKELELRPGETVKSDSFIKRNQVRTRGRALLHHLREGKAGVGANGQLRQFVQAVNDTLDGTTQKFDIAHGDDSNKFLVEIMSILRPSKVVERIPRPNVRIRNLQAPDQVVYDHPPVMENILPPLFLDKNKEQFKDFFARQHSPLPIIDIRDVTGEKHVMPQETFTTPNGLVYRLHAVSISTGHDESLGHVRPAIRTSAGDFTFIDDITGIKKRSKTEMTEYLRKNEGFRRAYYVLEEGSHSI